MRHQAMVEHKKPDAEERRTGQDEMKMASVRSCSSSTLW